MDFSIARPGDKVDIVVGDVTKQPNPRSGREMLAMAPLAVPVPMKDYVHLRRHAIAADAERLGHPEERSSRAPRLAAALDRLRWHGIKIQEVTRATQQLAVERFSIAEITKAPRPFQGHQEARLKGTFDKMQLTVDAGSLFIPANQPLARLAFYLIEPESDDGLVTWNCDRRRSGNRPDVSDLSRVDSKAVKTR